MQINVTVTVTAPPVNDEISVTIKDSIGVNFYLNFDDPSRAGVDSAEVTYKDFSGNTVTKTYQKNALPVKNGKHVLTVDIAPAQLADEITVKIGDAEYTQSVLAYCQDLKTHPEYSAYFPFVNALEQYAQTASDAFHYSDTPITDVAGLTAAEGFDSLTNTLSASSDLIGMIDNIAFLALTKPEFRFYMKDGETDERGITEEEAAACKVTAAFKDSGAAGSLRARFAMNAQGQVLVEVTGIQAKDLGRTVVVTIEGLGDTAQKIEFTGYDFAKIMVAQSNNADLVTAGIWA